MLLDDLRHIARRDKHDLLGVSEHQLDQLLDEPAITLPKSYQSIVLMAMGGSAVGGEMARVWPGVSVPFEIVRGYDIPHFVNQDTLVVLSSFSGNTEETLSALAQAEKSGAEIAIISSGGQLLNAAQEKNYPHIKLGGQSVRNPRMASLQGYRAFIQILEAAHLSAASLDVLAGATKNTQEAAQQWRADVATSNNLAKQIALELMGSSIALYGGPELGPIAQRWKISFNENSKNLAWSNSYPEFNHNEFTSWSGQPTEKPYQIINLRSSFESDRVAQRFKLSDQLLSGKRAYPITVNAEGDSLIEQMLWTAVLGDHVSVYLALLNNQEPSELPLVDKLKEKLK